MDMLPNGEEICPVKGESMAVMCKENGQGTSRFVIFEKCCKMPELIYILRCIQLNRLNPRHSKILKITAALYLIGWCRFMLMYAFPEVFGHLPADLHPGMVLGATVFAACLIGWLLSSARRVNKS